MPAEQLDFELATLFRNNQRKGQSTAAPKKRQTFDKEFVKNDQEEKQQGEMANYIQKYKTLQRAKETKQEILKQEAKDRKEKIKFIKLQLKESEKDF